MDALNSRWRIPDFPYDNVTDQRHVQALPDVLKETWRIGRELLIEATSEYRRVDIDPRCSHMPSSNREIGGARLRLGKALACALGARLSSRRDARSRA